MKRQSKLWLEELENRILFSISSGSVAGTPLSSTYSVDGSGNNLAHPSWGSAGSDLLRSILPAVYGDGISSPNGQGLPSARTISNTLGSQTDDVLDQRDLSAFIYAWGQFIDHDLDLTPDGGTSVPIAVPKGDPQFDPNSTGTQTLPFTRSVTDPATGTSKSNPLNQPTVVTSFLDGSMVYGSDATRAAALRTFHGGQLKTSAGNLLPLNTNGLPNANDGPFPDASLMLGGDIRANENIELTSLQVLFMREHNLQAQQLAQQHPNWTDEQLYQGARAIVIAEIQSITYNEYLPALLGPGALPAYHGYNSKVNPGITPEFSEAAFRFGHSQLDDDVQFITNNGGNLAFTFTLPGGISVPVNSPADVASGETGISLVDAFFDPFVLQQPGVEEGILKYLASDVAQSVDMQMVDAVRNILFGAPGSGAGGQDLFALDVQRGRDVGLATYNDARVAYGLPAVTSFSQITSDPTVQQELKALYGTVNKVELFVGGLAEDHAPGSSVGPTFQAIIANQFERTRDGDRLWYQNTMSGAQLRTIQNTSLADIIQRNTADWNLQDNVFFFHASISGTVSSGAATPGHDPRDVQGVRGATVQLIDTTNGDVVATTKTDARGNYLFDVTSTGQYKVQVAPADGTLASTSLSKLVTITRGDQFVKQIDLQWSGRASGGPSQPGGWPGGGGAHDHPDPPRHRPSIWDISQAASSTVTPQTHAAAVDAVIAALGNHPGNGPATASGRRP